MSKVDNITWDTDTEDFLKNDQVEDLADEASNLTEKKLSDDIKSQIVNESESGGLSSDTFIIDGRAPLNELATELIKQLTNTIATASNISQKIRDNGHDHMKAEAEEYYEKVKKHYENPIYRDLEAAVNDYNHHGSYKQVDQNGNIIVDEDGNAIYETPPEITIKGTASDMEQLELSSEPIEGPGNEYVCNKLKNEKESANKFYTKYVEKALELDHTMQLGLKHPTTAPEKPATGTEKTAAGTEKTAAGTEEEGTEITIKPLSEATDGDIITINGKQMTAYVGDSTDTIKTLVNSGAEAILIPDGSYLYVATKYFDGASDQTIPGPVYLVQTTDGYNVIKMDGTPSNAIVIGNEKDVAENLSTYNLSRSKVYSNKKRPNGTHAGGTTFKEVYAENSAAKKTDNITSQEIILPTETNVKTIGGVTAPVYTANDTDGLIDAVNNKNANIIEFVDGMYLDYDAFNGETGNNRRIVGISYLVRQGDHYIPYYKDGTRIEKAEKYWSFDEDILPAGQMSVESLVSGSTKVSEIPSDKYEDWYSLIQESKNHT